MRRWLLLSLAVIGFWWAYRKLKPAEHLITDEEYMRDAAAQAAKRSATYGGPLPKAYEGGD